MTRDRLGRGLGALLGEHVGPTEDSAAPSSNVSLTRIHRNPDQPRKHFAAEELEELAASIRENGLLQPLLVRPRAGDTYEIVAGERRFRALQTLGWEEAPVIVRDVDDQELLILGLVENLQREELGALEEAEGYRVLTDEHGLSQAEVARVVGKSRPTVANALRLLSLPPSVRALVEAGKLSAAHGRALAGVKDPLRAADLARRIVKEGWSVRETERNLAESRTSPGRPPARTRDPRVEVLERALEEAVASRVQLRIQKSGTGAIQIPFASAEDFERVFAAITGTDASDVLS